MRIRERLFNFLHFNKQERNGVFVLCSIIAILFLIRWLLPLFTKEEQAIQFFSIKETIDTQNLKLINDSVNKNVTQKEQLIIHSSSERFVFNPNTITTEDAIKLGLPKKTVKILIKYRSKGGKFYKPEDLKKLYGLSQSLYQELEPYILIPSNREIKKDTVEYFANKFKSKEKVLIDLNSSDSLAIVYLKGIGPAFTKRIIKYRTLLGGFHSMSQIKEIYGMTDSMFVNLTNQIRLDKDNITKIPINAIDFNSLRKHPYFNFQTAQAVVNYRLKHGKLTEKNFIELGIFNEGKLQLILPYLSY